MSWRVEESRGEGGESKQSGTERSRAKLSHHTTYDRRRKDCFPPEEEEDDDDEKRRARKDRPGTFLWTGARGISAATAPSLAPRPPPSPALLAAVPLKKRSGEEHRL